MLGLGREKGYGEAGIGNGLANGGNSEVSILGVVFWN